MITVKLINLTINKLVLILVNHKFVYNACKIIKNNVYIKLSMKKYEKVIIY